MKDTLAQFAYMVFLNDTYCEMEYRNISNENE